MFSKERYWELKGIIKKINTLAYTLIHAKIQYNELESALTKISNSDNLPTDMFKLKSKLEKLECKYNKQLQAVIDFNPEIQQAIKLCCEIDVVPNMAWVDNTGVIRVINGDGTMKCFNDSKSEWLNCSEDLNDITSGKIYPVQRYNSWEVI